MFAHSYIFIFQLANSKFLYSLITGVMLITEQHKPKSKMTVGLSLAISDLI